MIQEFSQTMQGWGVPHWVPVAAMIVVGVLLWGAGKRFLKLGLAATGFGLGAAMGHAIGDSLNLGVQPWVVGAGLGLVMAIVAAIAYRLLILVLLTGVSALAAPMLVLSVANLQDAEHHGGKSSLVIDEDLVERHEDALEEAAKAIESFREAWSKKIGLNDRGQARLDRLGVRWSELNTTAKGFWEQTPKKLRPTLTLATVAGGVAGLFMGIMAPSFGALLLTAFGGSLLWITGTRIVATQLGLPQGAWLPSPETHGVAFAGMWLITSLVGMGVQWFFRGKAPQNADKPA